MTAFENRSATSAVNRVSAFDLMKERFGGNGKPYSAMIEIADRCNEVCVHCYQIQGQKGEMTTAQLQQVLDQLAEMGILFLTISGGEATLRKDFVEILNYAHKKRFLIELYTNGINIDDELAKHIKAAAVQQVEISLYSHRPEVHDWVTKVPGSWSKTVDAIRRLIALSVYTVVKTPMMSFNADEYDTYIDFVKSLGADFVVGTGAMQPREGGDRSPESFDLRPDQALTIKRDTEVMGQWFPQEDANRLDQKVCGACGSSVHIEANGQIRPCTQLDIDCGDALKEGVAEARTNNRNQQIIRSLRWGNLHGCRDCDLRSYCNRCYARARTDVGDAMAPYPAACRSAIANYAWAKGQIPSIVDAGQTLSVDDSLVGPFRKLTEMQFAKKEDMILPEDRAFAEEHAWVRAEVSTDAPSSALRGQLVQIRRPGRKAAGLEKIPE